MIWRRWLLGGAQGSCGPGGTTTRGPLVPPLLRPVSWCPSAHHPPQLPLQALKDQAGSAMPSPGRGQDGMASRECQWACGWTGHRASSRLGPPAASPLPSSRRRLLSRAVPSDRGRPCWRDARSLALPRGTMPLGHWCFLVWAWEAGGPRAEMGRGHPVLCRAGPLAAITSC